MRRETIDASYAFSLVLDEIERVLELADRSGYAAAVRDAQLASEHQSLVARASSGENLR